MVNIAVEQSEYEENQENDVYFALFLRDELTKQVPIGTFDVTINNSTNFNLIKKNNAIFLTQKKGMREELPFDRENIIKITSDFYHDCEIVLKADGTIVDKSGIHKLKKISQSKFVKLERSIGNKASIGLYDDHGRLVAEAVTKEILTANSSVWIAIEDATNKKSDDFDLTILQFNQKVVLQDISTGTKTPNIVKKYENLTAIGTPATSGHYQKEVDQIIQITKKDDGRPVNTRQVFLLSHNKIDIFQSTVNILDSLHLMPLPSYPFPSAVRLLYGVLSVDNESGVFYRVLIDDLEYFTTITTDGQFVFFLDDEMVNSTTILNKETNKFNFTLSAQKVILEKNKTTQFKTNFTKIPGDFKTYNLGVITGVFA